MSQPFVFRNAGAGRSGVWHLMKPVHPDHQWRLLARSWCGLLWLHSDTGQQRPREFARTVPDGGKLCQPCQQRYEHACYDFGYQEDE